MFDLKLFSIILGFIGCFFVVFSFVCQLYEIYKTKNADGTSWGLIISQILTCLFLGTSAGINVYLDGIINLPFLVANVSLFLLFLFMVYFKIIYKRN